MLSSGTASAGRARTICTHGEAGRPGRRRQRDAVRQLPAEGFLYFFRLKPTGRKSGGIKTQTLVVCPFPSILKIVTWCTKRSRVCHFFAKLVPLLVLRTVASSVALAWLNARKPTGCAGAVLPRSIFRLCNETSVCF